MSNFRRNIIISNFEESGGSWYRICKDGIYTTTSAYINTGYKNFTNKWFEFWVDCKVLTEETDTRRLTGACKSGSNGVYNGLSFTGTQGKLYGNTFFGTHCNKDNSNITNFANARPYLNKKVRLKLPVNLHNYYCSIQFYNGDTLDNPIYSNYETIERYNLNCPYPMLVFALGVDGTPDNLMCNNIVIYETEGKQQNTSVYHLIACQLIQNIPAELASDNKPHQSGEYGMYNEVDGKFYGNASSTGYFLENID